MILDKFIGFMVRHNSAQMVLVGIALFLLSKCSTLDLIPDMWFVGLFVGFVIGGWLYGGEK